MKSVVFLLLLAMAFITSCCRYDDVVRTPVVTNCDKIAVVNEYRFNQTLTTNYVITNVVLKGDCLEVTASSSGCDPKNWDMNLIASENVMESFPVQRNAKIELINDE